MAKAGIIYNETKSQTCHLARELKDEMERHGWKVYLATGMSGILGYSRPDSPVCHTPVDRLAAPGFDTEMTFAVVLGGDGTVLSAFRQVAPFGIPLLTVNTGHLGFLTEVYSKELPEVLSTLLAGHYEIEERSMMAVKVFRAANLLWEALSLNEMVLSKEPLTGMCHFEVEVGKHALVDIAADGLIIATPTGSTAYALSAGGPVVTPGVSIFQLVPICPHSLASRALVFADSEPVTVSTANPNRVVMTVDGNAGCYVLPEDQICIQRSPFAARFIHLQTPEFFHILREKLGWGLPHIAKPT